ncbi:unnamed protein product [Sphenostylis stenocarpa]|uniref:Uncharacterized protein n=1 Tax=Sphenostylis stenocarpa TaxID=92480 RepID=A0AA86T330_9FABA|nr:unnamed protein product [Sphenostylis stenocarpa]
MRQVFIADKRQQKEAMVELSTMPLLALRESVEYYLFETQFLVLSIRHLTLHVSTLDLTSVPLYHPHE